MMADVVMEKKPDNRAKKKAYKAPRLTKLGSVDTLTKGTGAATTDPGAGSV